MTLTITVSMGLIGLVVDIGWAYWRKEACATTANSAAFAAIAAASSLLNQACGTDNSHWDCATYSCPSTLSKASIPNNLYNGCLYASQNGFLNTGRQSVSLTGGTGTPPVSGVSPAYWVSATATEKIPTLFSAVLGQYWAQVSVQSVAAIFQGTSGGCVYVLDKNASDAYLQNGSLFATGCGIYVNSNSSSAFRMNGATLTVTGGNSVSVVGQATTNGATLTFKGGGSLKTSQSAVANPISGLTAPTPVSPCTADPSYNGLSNFTIPSGTYCSLTVSGSSGVVLSGAYIITTGNFTFNGTTASTAAGGATIYFSPSNTGTLVTNGSNVTLTAPTSGSLNGFAIWDNNTTANSPVFNGNSATINGIIYMPNSALTFNGSNSAVQQTIIVDTLLMNGGNISQPAYSPYFSSGASISGNFIIQ